MTRMAGAEQTTAAAARHTIRIAAREVQENATRALRAAGLSAGEASVIADVVAEAEMVDAVGLTALLAELATVGPPRAGIDVHEGETLVLKDVAQRGPLRMALPAMELCTVEGAVFVPGLEWSPIIDWAAVDVCTRLGCSLTIVSTLASCVDRDGTIWHDVSLGARCRRAVSTIKGMSGLLLVADKSEGRLVRTPAERAERRRQVLRQGLVVDAEIWTRVRRAARNFLVPD